ncbi:hypothetical protein FB45DRAFT_287785 [Roridomyces roridus]|uniref:RING-type domain-containing protein n=1 Tax=Roridomyces roridus TaxID=1738132 RepID=A0AAD7FX39_9AGAR|nr:hypothetical protein FB45DRAFT_287785 [Roridomyces roridus]
MSYNNNDSPCYCSLCDVYFHSQSERMQHIQDSPQHPECEYCMRRFLNKNILRNHFIYSRLHNYCASCEIEFQTPAGLRYHIEHAPVHCDDSDSEDDGETCDSDIPEEEWEDEMGRLKYPDEPWEDSDLDGGDNSWEVFDAYDFESQEEIAGLSVEDEEEQQEEEEDVDENVVPLFSCPLCQETPQSVCCAPCGHIFCSPCITNVFKHEGACPVCSEPGQVEQLRKIFLA